MKKTPLKRNPPLRSTYRAKTKTQLLTLPIAPISVNKAYRGRRFATAELKRFKRDLGRLLPQTRVSDGFMTFYGVFGISDRSDLDNCLKATLDCLAESYGFDDKKICEIHVVKEIVRKGEEFIAFNLSPFTGSSLALQQELARLEK